MVVARRLIHGVHRVVADPGLVRVRVRARVSVRVRVRARVRVRVRVRGKASRSRPCVQRARARLG